VPEADTEEHEDGSGHNAGQGSDDDVRTIASRRSFESNGGGYTSAGPSTVGTDVDEDEDFSTSVDASAYGSRHKALEVALKEKTKRFLGLVKMDKVLSPSPSRRKLARSASKKHKEKPPAEFDFDSRRTSVSSLASLEPATPIGGEAAGRTSTSSNRPMADHEFGPPRRPSDASWMSTSPNQPVRRRFSVLKRTVSSRSSNNDGRSGDSHELAPEDIDENVDYREGVYDSSKKQRVPSWVRRLWSLEARKLTYSATGSCGSRSSHRIPTSSNKPHLRHMTILITNAGAKDSAGSRTLSPTSANTSSFR